MFMLRSFTALLLTLPAWSQAEVPAANFELVIADLSVVVDASATLPMNGVLHESATASFIEDLVGNPTGSELVGAALESTLPGIRWSELAAGMGEVRVRGNVQRAWTGTDWIVAQLHAKSEEAATLWSDLAPTSESVTGSYALPATLSGAQWLSAEAWVKREGSVVLIGFGATPPASVSQPFADSLGLTLLEPKTGTVPILEARGRVGLLIEAALLKYDMLADVSSWFAGVGDADAHLLMEATRGTDEAPGRILTRIRRDVNATTQTSTTESLFGVQPLKPDSLRGMPDTAMFASATTVNVERAILALLQDGDLDRDMLEAQLGFPLDRLLGRLGPNVRIWADPISGPAIPATFVQVEARETEAMHADLLKLLGVMSELDSSIQVRTRDYKVKDAATGKRVPVAITVIRAESLNSMLSNLGTSLNPALCVHDGSLLIASSSTRLKKMLKKHASGDVAGELNLAQPLADLGLQGATTVWRFDYIKMIDGLLSLARLAGGMAGDALPVDLSQLPTLDAFAGHFRPTFHAQGVDEKGRWIVHEASFGPETWLGLAGLVGKATESFMNAIEAPAAFGATTAPREPELPAPSMTTAATLNELRVGITVYEITTGNSPATLAELVATSESLPAGCLATDTVPLDSWGHAFRYEQKEAGGYRLWSMGVDGIDQDGAGDDVVAKL